MKQKEFTPQAGQTYQNINENFYLCLDAGNCLPHKALMQNPKSLWTFTAVDCRLYEDGRIDWAYSTGGFFAKEAGRIPGPRCQRDGKSCL